MLLSKLLDGVSVLQSAVCFNGEGSRDREIADVRCSTRGELTDCIYVCIRGAKTDGHLFAQAAEEKGAAVIVAERDTGVANQILVADSREAYALLCANLFGNPARELRLAAVTGTNGKTSVATTVKRLLCFAGERAGLISTIQAEYGERVVQLENTTPDAHVLHELFRAMRDEGIDTVVMEASSHALDQKRLFGLHFCVAVFTNLTQDHLDYHKSMVEYFGAKKKLFGMTDFAVVNIDDPYGRQLASELTVPYAAYSIEDPSAALFADEIECGETGVQFTLVTDSNGPNGEVRSRASFGIPGLYSVHNALAAAAACMRLGLSTDMVLAGLRQAGTIRGRNEVIETGMGFQVICDFAHTPDGLENILRSTRQYAKGRIVLLFGCGGDRDRGKRPQMGRIAAQYADFLIVTSDNPRTEQPGAIIGDILRGVPAGTAYIVIADRHEAIRYALATARRDDTVILAGKGHEQYQILGDKKIAFDERTLVRGILKSLEFFHSLGYGNGN